ncbi:helix-turn-helix domain-containing protein [Streptomyces sp. Tu10]|nr:MULTISPECIES: helix-turn-helix domain-containing protein [Streptomyces]MBT1099261.1 helix-turn-helix domain-containing protein [Streptomyces sp. Tu10]WUC87910.1 helix-turn-helix domain-containing protein [Streptomyces anulatus]WUD90077.1 helix-turn-helix domain-containing protein [Streptomyces anulatus]
MHDKQRKPDEALTELRRRLSDWLATSGLDKTQLARRTGMGRTTVSEAFQTDGPVPSARTLAALAMALGRPTEELLKLRRTAVTEEAEPADEKGPGPGRPIDQWEPHDLEVHPAGIALCEADLPRQQQLPSYVPREHDRTLAEAVRQVQADRSRMVVLSGTSSTGKTRACWEAIRPLARAGWKLWHPFDPTRAEGALKELSFVRPRTVIWLNEAQHYLGDMHVGEQIAAALHALLTDEARMPVLVLGTLWPEYAREYTALPATGRPDPYSRARELLAGRTVSVPEGFDAESLAAAARLAQGGDRLLADALTRADTHGRVTQDLAGAPELLRRYENGSPAAQALLQAAMDARRLRVGLHLPQAFLIDGATGYLTDTDYDNLADGWAQAAFAELAEQVHGKQAPLRRITVRPSNTLHSVVLPGSHPGPVFRLADYLEQHGRESRRLACPPASFWQAAHAHLTNPDDLANLAHAAHARYRTQWAHHLGRRAVDVGHPNAHRTLVTWLKEAGRHQEAESLMRQVTDADDPQALASLAIWLANAGNRQEAEVLLRQAFDAGNLYVLSLLADWRREAGDHEGAETLVWQAADAGHPSAWRILADWRREAGDHEEAETLARQAADAGHPSAWRILADWRREAGDHEEAETLARQAADAGDTEGLRLLVGWCEEAGDHDRAEVLARQAADAGDPRALLLLARRHEDAGYPEKAEALARQAAKRDSTFLEALVFRREEAGDRDRAEALARQAAEAGNWNALTRLAVRRDAAGDHEGAQTLAREASAGNPNALTWLGFQAMQGQRATGQERAEALFQQGADAGDVYALDVLAVWREEAGDRNAAEALAWQSADAGVPNPLARLVSFRERAGDLMEAQALARQAADAGHAHALGKHLLTACWPFGLDPDGTPTSRWQ